MARASDAAVAIGNKRVKLSTLDKVLYPKAGFTKAQVIDYYTRASAALLPHLRDRPLTLKRYPNGVDQPYFYEKRCPVHRPDWVATTATEQSEPDDLAYCMIRDPASLAWVANLASLELHTLLCRAKNRQ